MTNYNKILQIIEQLPSDFKVEHVDLKNANNRVLQEDVYADIDMPPFNKSAMDGYACRFKDLKNELEIVQIINAGAVSTKKVGKNQCVKIMTGAAVPDGCDCVFKVEDAQNVSGERVRCTNLKTNRNICYKGEDYKTGEVLIKKGTIIKAPQMAILAGAGYSKVQVAEQAKVTIIATGSELVAPNEKPEIGKIRNSNSSQLLAQLQLLNIKILNSLLIEDDYQKLTDAFKNALQYSDYVFFTGGASVGDFDFIPEILQQQGFSVFWNRTGIKPGNPMTFSQKGNKYCFGLSGNPVSSLLQFELFVKPVVYKLLGANFAPLRIKGKMNFEYKRKKADRLGIVPVIINNEGEIDPIPFHGSAHINALNFANALLEIQTGETIIHKDALTYVRPL